MSMKVGRNDPCPCGSGKKYKKCCLDKDQAKPPYEPTPSTPRGRVAVTALLCAAEAVAPGSTEEVFRFRGPSRARLMQCPRRGGRRGR